MALPGSQLARAVLDNLGLSCYKLYTQQRKSDRSYKIYGHYSAKNLNALVGELRLRGAKNVRAVPAIIGNGNAGVRFEY